jgi:hypothetical protein
MALLVDLSHVCAARRRNRGREANNNQRAKIRQLKESNKSTADCEKMKAPEPLYLLAARQRSFIMPLRTAVLKHYTEGM